MPRWSTASSRSSSRLPARRGGPHPIVFAWFIALGTAGFITILFLTSVAIIVFFLVRQKPDNVWSEVVAPSLSVLVLVYVGYLTLNNYTLLSGTDSTAEWLLLAVPVFLAAGVVRGATRKSIDYAAQII